MIGKQARLFGADDDHMLQAPLLAFWPGLCLAIVVYGINMFGDALRDLLDPRLRGGHRTLRRGPTGGRQMTAAA